MELRYELKNDIKSNQIIAKFKKVSKAAVNDIICAINGLLDTTHDMETVVERIEKAHLICLYMEPTVEDVVALLLYKPYSNHKIDQLWFKKVFKENRAERYYQWTLDAVTKAEKNEELTREEQIDHYIMIRVCDKMIASIVRNMNKKGVPDTSGIYEAYNYAKKAHYWDKRQSGEPYLNHPVCVAGILAEAGVESAIITAALLHDVVEDTDRILEDIANRFGVLVAKYVDAVTSVHRQYKLSHNMAELSCDKAELDAKSFEKLVEAVAQEPRMVLALYIKAADRIHNLMTIDKMSSEKKHAKTDETELDYLPLFKRFKLNYFVDIIEDLTWRTNNVEYYEAIKKKYEDIVMRNREYIEEIKNILTARLGSEFNRKRAAMGFEDGGYDVTVAERLYLTKEIYNFAKESLSSEHTIEPKHISKKTIPVCDINIIVEPTDRMSSIDNFVNAFINMLIEHVIPTGRTIIDFVTDKCNRYIIKLEDRHRAVFRLCISTHDDYLIAKMGSTEGTVERDTAEEETHYQETINVALRNGKIITLPNGATVIDVAFAIHPEVGVSVKSALVNGTKAEIYNILHDGDKVIIEADTYREDGVTMKIIKHARTDWLRHVETDKAKKALVRYFERKYCEGDNPRNVFKVSDDVAESVVNILIESLDTSSTFNNIE